MAAYGQSGLGQAVQPRFNKSTPEGSRDGCNVLRGRVATFSVRSDGSGGFGSRHPVGGRGRADLPRVRGGPEGALPRFRTGLHGHGRGGERPPPDASRSVPATVW